MTAGETCDCGCSRRVVLGTALGLVPWWAAKSNAEDEDPTEILPQVGDHFVYLDWPHGGPGRQKCRSDRGAAGAGLSGRSQRPGARRLSSQSRDPRARIDTTGASPETVARSANGVVAYSGVCTHAGCPVNMWLPEHSAFYCSCHGSEYNPKDGAEVIDGPAPQAASRASLEGSGRGASGGSAVSPPKWAPPQPDAGRRLLSCRSSRAVVLTISRLNKLGVET